MQVRGPGDDEPGRSFLEAPFTGSKSGGEDQRETVYYLGGDTGLVEMAASESLEPISSAILHIGPAGKRFHAQARDEHAHRRRRPDPVREPRRCAVPSGIADDSLFRGPRAATLAHSGLRGPEGAQIAATRLITAPQFALKHMDKDLRLALGNGGTIFSLPLEQTRHVSRQSYDEGIAAGWKEDDFIGLIRLLQKS